MRRSLALIRIGKFSHTNSSVRGQLERIFPDHTVVDIDVGPLIRRHRIGLVVNALATAVEYGPRVLRRRRDLFFYRWATADMFHRIRRNVAVELESIENLSFTFQTQSLFDARISSVPHFVYTDHTVATNRQYPEYSRAEEKYSRAWRRLESEIYEHADVVLTMSRHVSKSLHQDVAPAGTRPVCRGGLQCLPGPTLAGSV